MSMLAQILEPAQYKCELDNPEALCGRMSGSRSDMIRHLRDDRARTQNAVEALEALQADSLNIRSCLYELRVAAAEMQQAIGLLERLEINDLLATTKTA